MSTLTLAEVDVYRPGAAPVAAFSHGMFGEGFPPPVQQALESSDMLRASDVGYRSRAADAGGVQPYPPVLRQALEIDRRINLGLTATQAAPSWGGVVLSNTDGRYDGLAGVYNSDRRTVRILRGRKTQDQERGIWTDPAYSSLTVLFQGLSRPWSLTDDGLEIPVRDATYWLERPLLSGLYSGLGAFGGTPDLAGRPIPKLRGGVAGNPVQNVTPVLVDPSVVLYQVSDGPGAIYGVYTGGNSVGLTRAADVADPYATTCPAGQYRVISIATGLYLQFGTLETAYQVTCDAVGHFPAAGAINTAALLVRYLLTEDMGLPAELIDTASFVAATTATNYLSGDYWPAPAQGVEAISPILAGIGAHLVPTRDGRLRLIQIRTVSSTSTPVATFGAAQILALKARSLPAELSPPPARIRVSWARNNTVQASNLRPGLTAARQQYLAGQTRYQIWLSTTLLTSYRDPGDPVPVETRLLGSGNAQALANAMGAMWGTYRRLYDVTVPIDDALPLELGSVVRVVYPRGDLAGGALGTVVGESIRGHDATSTVTVLI